MSNSIHFYKGVFTCYYVLIGGRHLKEGGAYFKVKGIFQMIFRNFVNFSFQITINSYEYDIYSYIIHN